MIVLLCSYSETEIGVSTRAADLVIHYIWDIAEYSCLSPYAGLTLLAKTGTHTDVSNRIPCILYLGMRARIAG